MSATSSRRELLAAAGAAALPLFGGRRDRPGSSLPITKALTIGMLPKQLSHLERFQLARQAGFDSVECVTVSDPAVVSEIRQAATAAGVRIHSVMNASHWKYPLSSPDPAIVAQSVAGIRTSLENANAWGAGTVLLVPALVTPETSYREAWDRSRVQIRKLIPIAKELGVIIAVENVWNKFLLSPLEFAQYVDEFRSPWVRAYFDIGNVVMYGYPQDWIRTLGQRIAKVHVKDFRLKSPRFDWVLPGDGDVDWPAVRKALTDIAYSGPATLEVAGGELPHLQDLSGRLDRLVLGNP